MTKPSMSKPDAEPAAEPEILARRRWMAVLARAARPDLEAALARREPRPHWRVLRAPEVGLAMIRGRAGGAGAPFNLGEMSVTRCAVALEAEGVTRVGIAYIAGRDQRRAELAAVFDALLQDPTQRAALMADVVDKLAALQARRRDATAAATAATRVDFFTVAREVT
jgi:alpha-D-ribose 1-methylphosphonate 5-triphosphate synthase subunit PhnG